MFPTSKAFLTQEFTVNSYLSDLNSKLTIPSMFSLFQEVAWKHATQNGFGYEHLLQQGLFWALSRVKVQVNRLPQWGERFSLTTWPSGIDGIFALRDFQITDQQDQTLASACSSWLVVDIKTRRPRRLDSFREVMPMRTDLRALDANPGKIPTPTTDPTFEHSVTPKTLDLDVNSHTNNTKFVEWAVNSLPLHVYKSLEVKGVEINYLSEGLYNETCNVSAHEQSDGSFVVRVVRQRDARDLANVHIF